jgi:hypothetical protein
MEPNNPIHGQVCSGPPIREKKEEPQQEEPNHILKLKMLSQMARKLAYWIDRDTEVPAWAMEKIDAALGSMKTVNDFFMEQTVDVQESKLVPTKPAIWEQAKVEGKKRFNESQEKERIYASKWYKEHGGQWRKKPIQNG